MSSDSRSRLEADLQVLLLLKPLQTQLELHLTLVKMGWTSITKRDINSVLYLRSTHFQHDSSPRPRWSIRADTPNSMPVGVASTKTTASLTTVAHRAAKTNGLKHYAGKVPRDWQKDAWNAWKAAGRRGVVEAVTGTGKTLVGILCACDAAQRGVATLILVPGVELLYRWHGKLKDDTRGLRIGLMGDGCCDSLASFDILISTVQSAYRYDLLPPGRKGLLIADEVHRYGSEKFGAALDESFEERLGLTATFARPDDGLDEILVPFFTPVDGKRNKMGAVVAGCDYSQGLRDGILAPFRVATVGVELTEGEQVGYDEFDARAKKARTALIRNFGVPAEPFGEFMKAVSQLGDGGTGQHQATAVARSFLSAFTKRRALLAESERKIVVLQTLAPILKQATGALVFTETIESAENAAESLSELGIAAEPYTSKLTKDERTRLMERFRSQHVKVLAAPRVLDEGVDVPEADIGVIVAASQSRRQMIQRMGRIIRPKSDNRSATFFILYVRDTSEDPARRAHEDFLEEMEKNALVVDDFPERRDHARIQSWFQEEHGVATRLPTKRAVKTRAKDRR